MKIRFSITLLCITCFLAVASPLPAQDLGPHFKKIRDGIYVQSTAEPNSNCGIIVTQAGVVIIDSGFFPADALEVVQAVKKLTPLPIRYVIDTETHGDHSSNLYAFSPPATVIAHEGTSEAMKKSASTIMDRINKAKAESAEVREAFANYKMITPQIEYRGKMTLDMGDRTLVLLNLKNVHSEADTAIWLPKERVIFSASVAVMNSFNNIRTTAFIPDMILGMKMMKELNPEVVIPGHGSPGTTKIFDDATAYYNLLLERVGKMVKDGKSLDQIKAELRMPEYDSWDGKDRIPTNVEAAYRAIKGS